MFLSCIYFEMPNIEKGKKFRQLATSVSMDDAGENSVVYEATTSEPSIAIAQLWRSFRFSSTAMFFTYFRKDGYKRLAPLFENLTQI